MKKYKTLVLVCSNDAPELLKELIKNILAFNDEVGIIINSDGPDDVFGLETDDVHVIGRRVNFNHFDTMIPLHIEIKDYMQKYGISSEYVLFLSTNQLFIKDNLYDFMKDYSAGFYDRKITGHVGHMSHSLFKRYFKDLTSDSFVYQSNHDSMFFKYDIFMKMIDYFDDYRDTPTTFHNEEFLYVAYLMKHVPKKELVKFKKYSYWQKNWGAYPTPPSINVKELEKILKKSYYIIKRVNRNLDDPVREYIRKMK